MIDRTRSGARIAVPVTAARVRARERRNGFSIHAYTGSNGGGKTMAAVYDAMPSLAAGLPIVSTCRILDPFTGEPHRLWVPLDDFRLVPMLAACEVILDEVTGIAGARDSMALPSKVLNEWMQLRKDDVTLRWTTPNWKRADTGIREVTQGLTTCIGLRPVEAQQTTDYGTVRRWRQTRLFVWRTYDARKFDEWSTAKERSPSTAHRVKPVARQVLWGPGSPVRDMYDTYDHAISVGAVNDAGTCLDCGGVRSKPRCVCRADPSAVKDASPGMIRWALVDQIRRERGAAFTASDLPPHEVAVQAAPGRRRLALANSADTRPIAPLDLAVGANVHP